jgi:hypothetical protein
VAHISHLAKSPQIGEYLTMIQRTIHNGVEVKAGATVGPSDFAALQELRNQLGRKFLAGIVLYTGDQLVPFGDKLWLMPLPTLWAE